jgi:hypothetical protein
LKAKTKVEKSPSSSLHDFIISNGLKLNLTIDAKAKALRAEVPMIKSQLAEYQKYFV